MNGKISIVGVLITCVFYSAAVSQSLEKKDTAVIRFDDTRNNNWSKEFNEVEIKSSRDNAIQKAYFYKSASTSPVPLVVSLHTWSGDYTQRDDLAELCRKKDINYIHPDFRGINKIPSACCSELALADIDDAITYAMKNGRVDANRIYVIGVSGGGYATIASFMKSKHPIRKFSAWASITDLEAWYRESSERKNKYAQDILDCTGSQGTLNIDNARIRSPMYMQSPVSKLNSAQLYIYCGVRDGVDGSVPITHSINFYNKLLKDIGVKSGAEYVTDREKEDLMAHRRAIGDFGSIGGRVVCLKKESGNLKLTIFDGNHEMLTEYALNEILNDKPVTPSVNILTLGDSNGTFAYSWPKQIQLALPDAQVFNISKSGRTIGFLNLGDSSLNSLYVIDANLKEAAEATKDRPYDFIILELGTNDGKAIFSDRQKEVPGNLEKLIQRIKNSTYHSIRSAKIIIISPPPYGSKAEATEKYAGGGKRVESMSREFEKVANRNKCLFVNGYRTPGLDMETMTTDGLHLNADASKKLVEPVVKLISKQKKW